MFTLNDIETVRNFWEALNSETTAIELTGHQGESAQPLAHLRIYTARRFYQGRLSSLQGEPPSEERDKKIANYQSLLAELPLTIFD